MKPEPLTGTMVKGYAETTFTGTHDRFNETAWVERCETTGLRETRDGWLENGTVVYWFFCVNRWPDGPKSKLYKTEKGALAALENHVRYREKMVEVSA